MSASHSALRQQRGQLTRFGNFWGVLKTGRGRKGGICECVSWALNLVFAPRECVSVSDPAGGVLSWFGLRFASPTTRYAATGAARNSGSMELFQDWGQRPP